MATIGSEVGKILDAYKNGVLSRDLAIDRIGQKFNELGQNVSLSLQQESIRIGQIGTDLQAEQNVILKQLLKFLKEGK